VKLVEIGERPFVLEALVFLERVRMLAQKGAEGDGRSDGEGRGDLRPAGCRLRRLRSGDAEGVRVGSTGAECGRP